jgi:predicted ATPase
LHRNVNTQRTYSGRIPPESSAIIGKLGKDEVREALAAVYGKYTEGFGTPDLLEARVLLEELAVVSW